MFIGQILSRKHIPCVERMQKFSNNYLKRHDCVVEKIAEEFTTSDTEIYVNKLFSTTFPEFKEDQYASTRKPDIFIKTRNNILPGDSRS